MGHLRKCVSLLKKQWRDDHSSTHQCYKAHLDDNMINFRKCVWFLTVRNRKVLDACARHMWTSCIYRSSEADADAGRWYHPVSDRSVTTMLTSAITGRCCAAMCTIPWPVMMILWNWQRSCWCKQDASSQINEIPCMKMTCFVKTMKMHYVLKGINEKP